MLCSLGSIGNAVSRVKKICLFVPEMVLNKAILVRISVAYRAKYTVFYQIQPDTIFYIGLNVRFFIRFSPI